MSFDAEVYFADLPAGFEQAWQREIAAHGFEPVKVLVPVNWKSEGIWYISHPETPDLPQTVNPPAPEEAWEIHVEPATPEILGERARSSEERALLASAKYVASLNLPIGAGHYVIMCAVTLAKSVNGIVWDPQGTAAGHESAFYDTQLSSDLADQWFRDEQRNKTKAENFGSAGHEWVKINVSGRAVVYGDPTSIEKSGSTCTMWTLIDFKAPTTILGAVVESQMVHMEFDCQGKRNRPLSLILFSGKMGTGEIKSKQTHRVSENDWMGIYPGTFTEQVWNYACKRKLTFVRKLEALLKKR